MGDVCTSVGGCCAVLAVLVSSSVCRKSAGGEGGKAGNEVGGRDEGTQTTAPVSRASASASASGGVYQYGLGPSDNASIQEIQKAGHVRCVQSSRSTKSQIGRRGQPRSYPLHCKRQPSAPCGLEAHGRCGLESELRSCA